MKFSNNNSGFSLVEAMVGVAIISIMALTITRFSEVRNASKQGKLSTSCKSIAKSVIDHVKDTSVSSRFSSYFTVLRDLPVANHATGAITNIGGRVNAADVWQDSTSADTPFFNMTGSTAETNTFLLMESSIRVLTSIYNSPGWTANTFRDYAPITSNPTFLGLIVEETEKDTGAAPTIQISVTPYNIRTKALEAGVASPLFIRPENTGGSLATLTVNHAPTSRSDLGMRLAVQVNYSSDGTAQNCQSSHDFQYPTDTRVPVIDVFEITQNTYGGTNQNPNLTACGATASVATNVQIRLGVTQNSFEEGLSFVCRDNYVPSTYPPLSGPNYPLNSGHLPCNVPPATSPVRYGVGTDTTPITEGPPSTAGSLTTGGWTSCDQVTLCGQPIDTFSVNDSSASLDRAGAATNRVLLEMNYTIDPNVFCEYGMQAAAIDAAGNISAPINLTPPADNDFGTTLDNTTELVSTRDNVTSAGVASGSTGGLITSLYHDARPNIGKAPTHCTTTPLCTNPVGTIHEWHTTWDNQFPNGYYTCAATCCEVPKPHAPTVYPHNGNTGDPCHPYKDGFP